ncbi:MAG: class I SAM-dependent methyltransferase [Myxococcota bacterium]
MEPDDWDRRYEQTDFLWTAEPNRFLVREVEALAPGRALDLAAGEGRNAVWLAGRGWRVVAVDFSRVALGKARELAQARGVELDLELADARTYRPTYHGFDLVLVMYLHLPWAEMAPVLRRAAGAVAPGGTFLLVGHDRDNLERGHGGPPDAKVLYSAADVVREIGVDGLVIEKAGQEERPVATEEGTPVAIDCLVRARRAD